MPPRRGTAALTVALAVGVVASAASSAGRAAPIDAPAATAVPTTVAGAPVFDAVDFFSDFFGLAADGSTSSGDLDERVVAGSPADAFVTYLLGFGTARLDSRQGQLAPFTVTASTTALAGDEAVDVCNEGFCDQFSGFDVVDGRLRSFDLNGLPIDDRLAAPSKPRPGSTAMRVIGAFERVTVDELAVVVAIAADEELAVAWDDVVYANPDTGDIPVDLLASAYPQVIPGGGEQAVVLQFPTGDLGGELVLPYTRPSSEAQQQVRVTVEALQT
jgi:hypothetical protein